jgi:hypothetical protein
MASRPRTNWRTGDYVVGEVIHCPGSLTTIELASGREVRVAAGDHVVGALGQRCATLESVGDWRAVGDDLRRLEALTAAGVLGRSTSNSSFLPPLLQLAYRGHVHTGGAALNMRDCVRTVDTAPSRVPVILMIGTSMESGKTLSAKVIIRLLMARGRRVAGAKFTGVGRYRDILAMSDAGADCVHDFVDAGLPSTYCDRDEYEGVVGYLLSRISEDRVDVIVAEAGASPLEPYNGEAAIEKLRASIACTVLCASDPYAVLGVISAFDMKPDLIAGRATATTAGVDLVHRLSGIRALDLTDRASWPALEEIVERSLAKFGGPKD